MSDEQYEVNDTRHGLVGTSDTLRGATWVAEDYADKQGDPKSALLRLVIYRTTANVGENNTWIHYQDAWHAVRMKQ